MRDVEIPKLVGGAACLDFVNTLNGHRDGPLGEPCHEYLGDYDDLVLWARHAALLTGAEAEGLLVVAAEQPDEAGEAYRGAIELRETLYRLFRALAEGGQPQEADMASLNKARAAVLAGSRLIMARAGPQIVWPGAEGRLDRMLDPIVLSAVDLLTSPELANLRGCDGERCDWLFVDHSRNHFRRWCSMDHCGNRAKSRRQYERRKHAASTERTASGKDKRHEWRTHTG